MRWIKGIPPFLVSLNILILTACATPEYQLQPAGHPADTRAPSGSLQSSDTLAHPEPVDIEPARSTHWNNDQDTHQHHNHRGSVADDPIDILESEEKTHHLEHETNQHE